MVKDVQLQMNDLGKVDLKVGSVMECHKLVDSEVLWEAQVDIGEKKPRKIITSIGEYCSPELLVGKKIVVISNVVPVKIENSYSEGIILCADNGEKIRVFEPANNVKPGTELEKDSLHENSGPILDLQIDNFENVELKIGFVSDCQIVPDSSSLLSVEVELGENDPRKIITNIGMDNPELLVGKRVIIVSNRNQEEGDIPSEGMILCVDEGQKPRILETFRDVSIGTELFFQT